MAVDAEKRSCTSRLSFLRTKRAIAALSLLVVVSVVLIALGATNTIGPGRSHTNSASSASSASQDGNSSDAWRPDNSSTLASGTPLRIMCLGASLVRGEFSTDMNGFRRTLRLQLADDLGPGVVNMVGSQRYGVMLDNDEEAYGGNRVEQTYAHATAVVPQYLPNLFVIQSGTNNVLQDNGVGTAGADMEALIDYLLKASPRATVIFSTCLTNTVEGAEPGILRVNDQYRALIAKYDRQAVLLAEMHPSSGLPNRPQVADIGPDGTHPYDHGYDLMGDIFVQSIRDADARGYFRWPEDNGIAYDGETGRTSTAVTSTTTAEPTPSATSSTTGGSSSTTFSTSTTVSPGTTA
ncbi:carbohydrate esterase family 3 protein [Xylariaceae sp. FL0016]|nr:carbohydrate esterase family 3 protein [Xylariaceae sp. FL0016]